MKKRKKILLIEDDKVLRENTTVFLEEEHYKVISAEDGIKGVQLALEEIPDIIVCDIAMPKLDGYEVFKTLHEITATSFIPFIFLTARSEKEDMRAGMQLGADDYITKPYEYEDLLTSIKIRLNKQEKLDKIHENKYFALINNPIIGVFTFENDQFSNVNSKMKDILGYSKEELLEMSFKEILINDDYEKVREKVNKCLNGIQTSIHETFDVVCKDESTKAVEIYAGAYKLMGKTHLIGNMLEITQATHPNQAEGKSDRASNKIKLSKREMEVLELICQGMPNSQIAETLFISQRTVDGHRANLINKTGVKNTADLVMYAVRNNLVKP